MMGMRTSFRIEHRSSQRAGGQRRHDLRIGRQPGYVDAERSDQNSVLIEPLQPAQLRQIVSDRAAAQPGRQRALMSNAAIVTNGILTFSKDAQAVIEQLTPEEQDSRIRASCEAAAELMGVELTGLVVHRDEAAIHAHCQFPSRRPDGMPLSKTVDCRKLQDVAAEAWSDLGITRGKPKAERVAAGEPAHKWVHRSVKELHEDLPAELDELRERVAEHESKAELAATRAAKAQADLSAARGNAEKLKKRIETYKKREQSHREKLDKANKELQAIESKINKSRGFGRVISAAWGGITGSKKKLEKKLDQERRAKERAIQAAKKRDTELKKEQQRRREQMGQAQAAQHRLKRVESELGNYKTAAHGLSPDALKRVVKRGLDATRNQSRDNDRDFTV